MPFLCRKCGKVFSRTGTCPDCSAPLEKVCPVCGLGIDSCVCFKAQPQTKGHPPR